MNWCLSHGRAAFRLCCALVALRNSCNTTLLSIGSLAFLFASCPPSWWYDTSLFLSCSQPPHAIHDGAIYILSSSVHILPCRMLNFTVPTPSVSSILLLSLSLRLLLLDRGNILNVIFSYFMLSIAFLPARFPLHISISHDIWPVLFDRGVRDCVSPSTFVDINATCYYLRPPFDNPTFAFHFRLLTLFYHAQCAFFSSAVI